MNPLVKTWFFLARAGFWAFCFQTIRIFALFHQPIWIIFFSSLIRVLVLTCSQIHVCVIIFYSILRLVRFWFGFGDFLFAYSFLLSSNNMPRGPPDYNHPNWFIKYPLETKIQAKRLVKKGKSYREVKRIMGLSCHPSSIMRWSRTSFDPESVRRRRLNQVYLSKPWIFLSFSYFSKIQSHPLLTDFQRQIVAGWVVYRNLKGKSTTTLDLSWFLERNFSIYPKSKAWISNFCKNSHLSYKQTSIARWAERSAIKWSEAIAYINRVRHAILHFDNGKELPLNKVAVVDKTKFNLKSHRVRHISIKGGFVFLFFFNYFIFQSHAI